MHFSAVQLTDLVSAWMWPFFRIAAFMTAAPVFGNRPVPTRVRIGLAAALTLVIVPNLPPTPSLDPLSLSAALVSAQQVLIGIAFGFAVRLVFIVLEVAGQQIAQLMGLGFAALVDPQNGIEVPVVSNFYIILGTLVFLSLDGHLLAIQALSQSFVSLPISTDGIGARGLWHITGEAGWMFSAAVLIVLPGVAALLCVNLAFGVMSRAAPQLNIFAVGFPITLLFGFVVMLLTLPGMISLLDGFINRALLVARSLVEVAP